jgi:hypothetical protein
VQAIFTEEQVKDRIVRTMDKQRFQETMQYSNNIGQNIIYRIAKEVHGYDGANDMSLLQAFFSEGKADATGLYYDGNGTRYD